MKGEGTAMQVLMSCRSSWLRIEAEGEGGEERPCEGCGGCGGCDIGLDEKKWKQDQGGLK